jgi:hypothetical protein
MWQTTIRNVQRPWSCVRKFRIGCFRSGTDRLWKPSNDSWNGNPSAEYMSACSAFWNWRASLSIRDSERRVVER